MTKVLLDTDKAAVIEAVSGATVTDAGTPASDDKVLIQDTSDSDNLKYVNIADLPGGGTGDVVGPASSTDNAIARFDSTTGKLIQNSTVSVSGTNVIKGEGSNGVALDSGFGSSGTVIKSHGVTVISSSDGDAPRFAVGLSTNTIAERTAASGVTIDGLLIKDASITFDTSNLKIKGSSTGVTSLASANASATNYTATFPAASIIVARADAAQTFTGIQTFTSPVINTGIELGHATDTTLSRVSAGVVAIEGVNIVTTSSTDTLTNKRINARIDSSASSSSITPNKADFDEHIRTAQAVAITINNSTSPTVGDKHVIYITDNATLRAITFDTHHVALDGLPLPTTTVAGKSMEIIIKYVTTTKAIVSYVNQA